MAPTTVVRIGQLLAPCQNDVRGVRRGNVLAALVTELCSVETAEKVLSGAEQDGRNRQVHLVDQSGAQILPDRSDPAAEPDVLAVGCIEGALKCSVDAVGNEVEGRAAVH